jgi:Flp pilus assembly protein TadD
MVGPTKTLRTETSEARTGQTISGKFRILKEIGRGGMGVVYEAEDLSLKRTVALKFLPADLTRDPEARDRFVQEAQAASGLDHPNICTVHEIGETEAGDMYIAMARYKGKSLKDAVEEGSLSASDVIAVAAQIAEGLASAHEQGIVHRDIKPSNVFLTSDATVKILDFGLAKLAGQMKWTRPGMTLGTVDYMSPEQVRGEEVDGRTDIWSLGVLLYEMVTGGLPFRGETDRAVFHAILTEPPRAAGELRTGFPAGIEGIIRKALAKDPAKRFGSAREMVAALRDLERSVTGVRPTARRLSFGRGRRKTMVVSAASLLSLAAVGIAVWLLTRPGLAFESRDKLMVADVDNQTGDKVFDLALRTAIEADLQQSPYAAIFDRPQIAETLRLMRQDPGAKVDEATGCEICRFAGVRAFVLPRIISAGEAYELEAILIDPVKPRHVDRIRVTARGREDVLLHAIDKLAGEVRSRLGESLSSIQKANRTIARVTTSSWDALNYFSQGQSKWQQSKFKDAAALLELALEKDPKFVDARSSLGLLYFQFLDQPDKGKAMLRQALDDAENQKLAERDILKLRAANKQFVDGDLAGALEQYRLLRELFPDFMPPWNNSGMILRTLGRYAEAAAMFEKAAELAPRNSIPLTNLWFTDLDYLKDAAAAEKAGRRLVTLSPELANSRHLLGYSLAAQGRFDEAEKELRKTLELEPDHAYALPNLAYVLFAAGKAADSVPFYRRLYQLTREGRIGGSAEKNAAYLALALRRAGDDGEAAKVVAEAKDLMQKRLKNSPPDAQDLVIMGQLAAAEGQAREAAGDLVKARERGGRDPYTLMDIAELSAQLGQKTLALETLKKAYQAGYVDYFFPVILPGFQPIAHEPEFRAFFKLGG